jgi:hypothetical protein
MIPAKNQVRARAGALSLLSPTLVCALCADVRRTHTLLHAHPQATSLDPSRSWQVWQRFTEPTPHH